MLRHWIVRSAAWKSLKPTPRALYFELRKCFNGGNNGKISLSVREAVAELHIAKDSASKAFRELEAKGFIKCRQRGNFNWKLGFASIWILTEESYWTEFATKEFMRWIEKERVGPISRTPRSQNKDDVASEGRENVANGTKSRTKASEN